MYSKQYNTGTETDTESMGQDRKARNKPSYIIYGQIIFKTTMGKGEPLQ